MTKSEVIMKRKKPFDIAKFGKTLKIFLIALVEKKILLSNFKGDIWEISFELSSWYRPLYSISALL